MNSLAANEEPGDDTLIERARVKMLQRLAGSSVFVKNQQRGEKPLTDLERFEILSDVLASKPGLFIERYNDDLIQDDLVVFKKLREKSTLVAYYFEDLDKKFNKQAEKQSKVNVVTIKNRRYTALQRLIKDGDYFS